LKFTDIFKKNGRGWLSADEFDVNQGKANGGKVFTGMLVFAPLAVLLSCFVIIMAVVGIPNLIDLFKTSLDSVYGGTNEIHQVAPRPLFTDVGIDSKYYTALGFLKKHGVISGYDDKSFKPEEDLTRADLVRLIVSAKRQFPLMLNYNSCFKDVRDQWFAPAICLAKDKGWISGFEDQTFHPESSITKVEALKMMVEAFQIKRITEGVLPAYVDVDKQVWYAQYVNIALDNGLLNENAKNEKFEPMSVMTRGYAAQILYRILLFE